MMISDKKNSIIILIYGLFSFAFLLLLFLFQDILTEDLWIGFYSIASFIQVVSCLLIYKHSYKYLFNPAVVFFLLLIIFYYSHVWLIGFFKTYTFSVYNFGDAIRIYPVKIYQNALMGIYAFILFYFIGSIFNIPNKNRTDMIKKDDAIDLNKIKIIAIIILIISVPLKLYISILYFMISIRQGYLSIYSSHVSDYLDAIANISVVGFILLLYSCRKKGRIILLFAAILLYSIDFFAGNRLSPICSMLTLLLFYNCFEKKNRKKIKLKTVLFISLLLIVMVILVETVKIFRGNNSKTIASFIASIQMALQNNVFLRFLDEIGSSVAVPSLSLIYIKDTGNYLYGWTYISGLFSIFPNWDGIIQNIQNSGTITYIIKEYGIYGAYKTIGGSCIAESFMNFGYLFGPFAWIIGYVARKISNTIATKDLLKSIYFVMPTYALLYWVRSNFALTIREIVWSWIIIFILIKITSNGNRKYNL